MRLFGPLLIPHASLSSATANRGFLRRKRILKLYPNRRFALSSPQGSIRRLAQENQFMLVQLAQLPGLLIQHQRPVAHPANLLHKVPNLFKHLAELAVSPLYKHYFVPRIIALPYLPHPRRRSSHAALARCAFVNR